jgi:predicted nuclease of predicted toxin-antitoxin system
LKLRDFPLLTDENLHPTVIAYLRQTGFHVWDVCEQGLQGSTDLEILRLATPDNRVVVTHDPDFGTLAILNNEPVVGVIYLRPGHMNPQFTIDTLARVLSIDPDVVPPFILVAKRTGPHVTIRIRHLGP